MKFTCNRNFSIRFSSLIRASSNSSVLSAGSLGSDTCTLRNSCLSAIFFASDFVRLSVRMRLIPSDELLLAFSVSCIEPLSEKLGIDLRLELPAFIESTANPMNRLEHFRRRMLRLSSVCVCSFWALDWSLSIRLLFSFESSFINLSS